MITNRNDSKKINNKLYYKFDTMENIETKEEDNINKNSENYDEIKTK